MIVLTKSQMDQINLHSEETYPRESCGLLVGQRVGDWIQVCEVHRSENVAMEPTHRFEVNPQLRFDLERWLRKGSLELVGVYHSHPEGDALPSCTDIARAWEPNLIWLITAVKNGSAQMTKGYLLAESLSKFEEAQLKIISNESSYV